MGNHRLLLAVLLLLTASALLHAADTPEPTATPEEKARRLRAKDVFDFRQSIIFQDDFQSGQFVKWGFSEDAQYGLPQPTPERIRIVDAPGLGERRKAVRFFVERAPDSFRSEISLPHEFGFQETGSAIPPGATTL
jgi:hypothetical protein